MRYCSLLTEPMPQMERMEEEGSQVAIGCFHSSDCEIRSTVGQHCKPPAREVGRGALVAQKPGIGHSRTDLTSRSRSSFSTARSRFMGLDLSSMALAGTRATAVDLGRWIFINGPVVPLCWIKNILFLVSVIAGVGVSLLTIFLIATSILGRSIYFIRRVRDKSQPVPAAESLGKPIPLQDRNASHEKSAEQPLVAEDTDMDV